MDKNIFWKEVSHRTQWVMFHSRIANKRITFVNLLILGQRIWPKNGHNYQFDVTNVRCTTVYRLWLEWTTGVRKLQHPKVTAALQLQVSNLGATDGYQKMSRWLSPIHHNSSKNPLRRDTWVSQLRPELDTWDLRIYPGSGWVACWSESYPPFLPKKSVRSQRCYKRLGQRLGHLGCAMMGGTSQVVPSYLGCRLE